VDGSYLMVFFGFLLGCIAFSGRGIHLDGTEDWKDGASLLEVAS